MVKVDSISEFALFYPEIKEFIEKKDYKGLLYLLERVHPADIAYNFDKFTDSEKLIILRILDEEKAVEIFEMLSPADQRKLLEKLKNEEVAKILEDMASDERADLFGKLPEKLKERFFSLLKDEDTEDIRRLLKYEEDTAGGIMSTDFITIKKEMTAEEAILYIQKNGYKIKARNLYAVYVVEQYNKLIGGVSLKTLLTANPKYKIEDVMRSVNLIKIKVDTDREEVARIFKKYDLLCAPVVDESDRLLGIITVDDIMDVISEEATEDIYGLGKIASPEEVAHVDYPKASIFMLARARMPWLIILLIIEVFVSGKILKGYSSVLESVVLLAAFIPMLMDSGGNVGSQSLTLMVRALALKQVTIKSFFKVIWKELKVGFLIGFSMGSIAFIASQFLSGPNLNLGITVGITLCLVMLVANLTGAMLPFIFTYVGLDPAVAASPFITTVVDATALILYFEIAKKLILVF